MKKVYVFEETANMGEIVTASSCDNSNPTDIRKNCKKFFDDNSDSVCLVEGFSDMELDVVDEYLGWSSVCLDSWDGGFNSLEAQAQVYMSTMQNINMFKDMLWKTSYLNKGMDGSLELSLGYWVRSLVTLPYYQAVRTLDFLEGIHEGSKFRNINQKEKKYKHLKVVRNIMSVNYNMDKKDLIGS